LGKIPLGKGFVFRCGDVERTREMERKEERQRNVRETERK
jgi:hypothetical protein